MATDLVTKPAISVVVTIQLNEAEMRMLEETARYSEDAFIGGILRNSPDRLKEVHAAAARSLYQMIRRGINPVLARTDKARSAFDES